MRVISYPSFAKEKARKEFRLAVSCAGGAAILGILSSLEFSFSAGFGLMAMVAIIVSAGAAIRGLRASQGQRGEDRVQEAIQGLDDRYTLVRNWVPESKTGDVDMVLLGPHGALVLEVKTYSVPVRVENGLWSIQRENGSWRKVKSFSKQLDQNSRMVQKTLKAPTYGALVFNDGADLRGDAGTTNLIRVSQVRQLVDSLPTAPTLETTWMNFFPSAPAA